MQDLPHHYAVNAHARSEGDVTLGAAGVPPLASCPPPEFGGPEGYWSPESLLTAAVADCFVLSFRAIARASKLDWQTLDCDVTGVLDRVEGRLRFTGFSITARLAITDAAAEAKAAKLLDKAEANCLVSASLSAPVALRSEIRIA
ncbi:MAG: OsmC family protein [Pseudomonadales bacterium]|nr:OsmC family protein [Pseudomonadales bacterium]